VGQDAGLVVVGSTPGPSLINLAETRVSVARSNVVAAATTQVSVL